MNLIDLFNLVYKNLMEKKSRAFLTISGIIIGIFTFTFFLFVSQGLSNAISEQFSGFGLNVLVVQSANNQNSNGPPGGSGLTQTDLQKIKQVVRDYKYITPQNFYSQGQWEYGREKQVQVAVGFPDEYFQEVSEDIGFELVEGRLLKSGDQGVIVLGAKAVESYETDLKVGSSVKINDESFRVIGILKERGDLFLDNAFIVPFEDIGDLRGDDTYTAIRISFLEGADLELMEKNIENRLNPNGDEKTVSISSPKDAIERFNQILGVLTLIISFVSAIALLVGGINVMNTMYSSVLERVQEISAMKALGATNNNILGMFLIESSFLGFVGALIGFVGAYILAEGLSYMITNFAGYNVPVNFSLNMFLAIILITTFFAMLFGTYPAWRGAKVNPADNLRDE